MIAALTALIALAALLSGALLSLTPAHADGHGPTLTLTLVDDSDGIVPPGSEVTIEGRLRFSGTLGGDQVHELSDAALTLSGFYDWGDSTSRRLSSADFDTSPPPNPSAGRLSDLITPTRADGTPVDSSARPVAAALHLRTLLGTSVLGEAYLFDAWSRRQVALIRAPASVDDPATFGRTDTDFNEYPVASGAAVWQESADTAWLFIASPDDDIGGFTDVGSVYIYKVDWSTQPAGVTLVKRLAPPRSEFSNVFHTGLATRYGSSITMSGDGSTLAVGAQRMNHMGAVYVYSRPEGEGRSWGSLEYADGVKLTVQPTPAWGDPGDESTRPFSRTGSCDLWCRRVLMLFLAHEPRFAFPDLALSGDGGVLLVSAHRACQLNPDASAGVIRHCATASYNHVDQGQAWVFVAPEGGWQAAPLANAAADGAPKTLVEAGEDAAGFDPDTHYAPGPLRRVSAASARVRRTYAHQDHFGQTLDLSEDGLTIALSEAYAPGSVYVIKRNALSDWSGVLVAEGNYPSYDRAQSDRRTGNGGVAFNQDASQLLISDPYRYQFFGSPPPHPNLVGGVYFWHRGGDGNWGTVGHRNFADVLRPTVDVADSFFGVRPFWGLSFARWAVSWPLASGASPPGFFVSDGHNCVPVTLNGEPGVECLIGSGTVVIPPGEDGTLTVSGAATLARAGAAGSETTANAEPLVITIGEVVEVAELKLERATDDRGTADTSDDVLFPDQVARGETTTLHIQVLNENGKAAGTNSLNLVSVQTNVGELSTSIGGSCRGGNGGKNCIIEGSNLTASNSDKIKVTLRHAGTAGAASVTARAISRQGEQAAAGPLSIALTGAPTALSIAAPGSGLLGVDTTDAAADVDERDVDNRDQLTLAVTATDERGAKVAVPTGGSQRAWLTGPDGARVTEGVAISYPLLDSEGEPLLDAARNRQVRVNVNRAAAQALPNGEYTLSVRAGNLTAERTIMVSGAAAEVALSDPSPAPAVQQAFTVVATVTDADGAAVPNGTSVHWDERTIGDETTMLVQTSQQTTTTDGTAEASYLIVSPGVAVVTVTADGARTSAGGVVGGVSNVIRIAVADPAAAAAAAQPASLADQLSATTPGAPTSWLGAASVTASALLDALDGVNRILLWQYGRWLSYAVVDGREIPGSYDFVAQPGAVLWLVE